MNKKLIPLLLILVLILAGCKKAPLPSYPTFTEPTLPTIDQSLTPQQMLSAAVDTAKASSAYVLKYGYTQFIGDRDDRQICTQSVTIDNQGRYTSKVTLAVTQNGKPVQNETLYTFTNEPDSALVFRHMGLDNMNPHLLADFSATPLRAIPSNVGAIRFLSDDLTMEELIRLACGRDMDEDDLKDLRQYNQVICSLAISIDTNTNCFTALELIFKLYDAQGEFCGSVTHFLQFIQMNI